MHGVSTGSAYGLEDLLDIKVGLGTRRTTQRDRHVGLAHEGRVGIGLGIDSDGLNAHGSCRPKDTARDLAAIGHQDASHGDHIRKTP